jgi:hypothetical protein
MMISALDPYSGRARALPVYLTIAPIPLVVAAILPGGLDLPLGGAAAIVFVPLAFLAGELGGDFGKRLEGRLWCKWDGAPTTRFLRHSNQEFNQATRARVHEKLRALGLHVPSADEEERDRQAADVYYVACTKELIRRTRDSKRFPLVFNSLTSYGFRRNLLALKPIGLPVAVVALLVCIASLWIGWDGEKSRAVAVGVALVTSGLLLVWLVWVNEKTVALAANRYARFLLEAALELE